jgi:hypothetical protein
MDSPDTDGAPTTAIDLNEIRDWLERRDFGLLARLALYWNVTPIETLIGNPTVIV